MKKLLKLIGIYLIAIPLTTFADFNDVLPIKNQIDGDLPHGDATTHWIPRFIDILIKFSYTISVAFMIYAAWLYIFAHGDETNINEARDIFIYSIVGFLVITISYAFVEGVTKFNWIF